MSDYIHLHNHSHYSLLDAACTVDGIVNAAKADNMPAVALTDHGVMFGVLEFVKKCRKAGIKPIIGNEMYMVTKGSRHDRKSSDSHPEGKRHGYNHIVLLVRNETGYRNLLKLTTLAHTEGFYYKPRIDFELLERYHEGLIALTACSGGVVASYLVAEEYDAAKEIAVKLKNIFGGDVYLEIQDHGLEREAIVRTGMKKLAGELGMKLICTNDCHYMKREHAVAHNVLLHIPDVGATENIEVLRYGTDQVYFKTQAEMIGLFKEYPDAIASTLEVADKCTFDLKLGTNYMPEFPIPPEEGGITLDEYLRSLAEKGLPKRYEEVTPGLKERLDYELGVISRMGYSGYFLIVQDFIIAAKKRGIRVGPGRGSAAGSLVAYVLEITDVDPLRYDLLFERFLNPDRVSMPDIDVDFQDDRREEVIQYVREKYGNDSVSQIITFGKLSSRAVLKDVGRVLGVPLGTVESITKHITTRMGKVEPLAFALGIEKDDDKRWDPVPELKWVMESTDEKIRQMIEYSRVLEGLNRNAGMHAAGVVIAPSDTSDFVPLYKTPHTELMTMYNMTDLEEAGLLKMDFLGLITLTVIDQTLSLIRQTRGIDLDISSIPLDDAKTYELYGNGQTVGVFQFESPPMRAYLCKLKPQSIDDLAAMNALYRPGPMEFIDDFIDRKFGRKQITYLHPSMEPILKSTYGIIVFQEQVMQLASEVAGFTLAQSDLMRRAMGKKKLDVMAQQREAFVKGAGNRGISKQIATDIFDMIDKFANYGFNKSHSVAYSLLAYQTSYLKAHYTPEFMAALLTSEMANNDKIAVLIDECRKLGIDILPPDINESVATFSVKGNTIRFGMAAIKNVGAGPVDTIVREREDKGSFKSLFEFCERVDTKAVNKKTVESLVLAGAMDSLHSSRASLLEAVESAISFGQTRREHAQRGQSNLFDELEEEDKTNGVYPQMPDVREWSTSDRLVRERSVLGFYVSGHPMDGWR
jgi:DNA polymerase-3 subunit alpha